MCLRWPRSDASLRNLSANFKRTKPEMMHTGWGAPQPVCIISGFVLLKLADKFLSEASDRGQRKHIGEGKDQFLYTDLLIFGQASANGIGRADEGCLDAISEAAGE